jgi:hypothetical protein
MMEAEPAEPKEQQKAKKTPPPRKAKAVTAPKTAGSLAAFGFVQKKTNGDGDDAQLVVAPVIK